MMIIMLQFFFCFAVDDLVKNYRLGILKTVKQSRANPRSKPKVHPPVDILSIDARTFAEQLTYVDAVSIVNVLSEVFVDVHMFYGIMASFWNTS